MHYICILNLLFGHILDSGLLLEEEEEDLAISVHCPEVLRKGTESILGDCNSLQILLPKIS